MHDESPPDTPTPALFERKSASLDSTVSYLERIVHVGHYYNNLLRYSAKALAVHGLKFSHPRAFGNDFPRSVAVAHWAVSRLALVVFDMHSCRADRLRQTLDLRSNDRGVQNPKRWRNRDSVIIGLACLPPSASLAANPFRRVRGSK